MRNEQKPSRVRTSTLDLKQTLPLITDQAGQLLCGHPKLVIAFHKDVLPIFLKQHESRVVLLMFNDIADAITYVYN